jgi:hypothetical protein
MPPSIDRCLVALNLSHVRRWAIAPMKRDLTVGDHVYRSQIILKYLFEAMSIDLRDNETFGEVLLLLLMHDVPESFSGDTPAPFKRVTAELHRETHRAEDLLCPEVTKVVNGSRPLVVYLATICDLIECYTWFKMYGPDFWPHPWAENRGYIMRKQVDDAVDVVSTKYLGWDKLGVVVDTLLDHLTPAAREKDAAAPSLAKGATQL